MVALPQIDNERFTILERLGAGAFGEVFLALDLKHGRRVALKILRNVTPKTLALFKQEFRSLAEVVHPNLVQFYELFAEGELWYFTMEPIEGRGFLRYIREGAASPGAEEGRSGPLTAVTMVEDEADPATEATLIEPQGHGEALTMKMAHFIPPPEAEPEDSAAFTQIGFEPGPVNDHSIATPTAVTRLEAHPLAPKDPAASEGDETYMEFVSWAGSAPDAPAASEDLDTEAEDREAPWLRPGGLARLRRSLGQLASGVNALHRCGKLHRDLKPSNIMVTEEGKVILLDFGLVKDLSPEEPGRGAQTRRMGVVGTPRYMAPEQAAGQDVDPACDWYSVGVILYEALTGRPPFDGDARRIMRAKQREDPPRPRELEPQVPADLDKLCMDLLERSPEDRISGEDMLSRLGLAGVLTSGVSTVAELVLPTLAERELIGREPHLKTLRKAFAKSREGYGVGVYIHGRAGMGKSFLMQRFVRELQEEHQALVLGGRCYQRESMPYKGWDDGMSSTARYLRSLTREESAACVPEDVQALVRLFPVLRRVETFEEAASAPLNIRDPKEIQRRAYRAAKELFLKISQTRALVLILDDMQWGDLDSAALLWEICKPPDNPAVMFMGTYRSDEVASNPVLRETIERFPGRQLELGGLERPEIERLVESLIGNRACPIDLDSLERETEGNPHFVTELLCHALSREGSAYSAGGQVIQLDDMIRERVSWLPGEAKAMLEVVCAAAGPVPRAVLERALGPESSDMRAMALLRHGRFIRVQETELGQELESDHARIRDSVLAELEPERRRAIHRRLAEAFEHTEGSDLGDVALHLREAGETERAAVFSLRAADRALENLAFAKAAELYRLALTTETLPPEQASEVRFKLGECLTNVGRGREAAPQYLKAAELAEGERSLRLRQRAAHQYFTSGHLEEGLEVMREVLAKVGMRLPDYKPLDLAAMVRRELRFRWRGSSFVERKEEEVEATKLLAIDTCWTVVAALATVDLMASVDFCMRMVLLALETGEPRRIARALGAQAYMDVNLGRLQRRAQMRRARRLLGESTALAARAGDPHTTGFAALMRASVCYADGRFRRSVENSEIAITILRDECLGVAWELDTAYCFLLWSLLHLGRIRRFCTLVPERLEEGEQRRDLYALLVYGGISLSWHLLFQDRPEEAEERVGENLRRCSKMAGRSGALHLWARARTEVNQRLYRGQGAEAWERVKAHWSELEKLKVLEIQYTRTTLWDFRGRAALAAARSRKDPALLKEARAAARALEKEPVRHGPFLGRLILLGADAIEERSERLEARLAQLEEAFRGLEMALHAAVCLRWRGTLIGGEKGGVLKEEAEAFMREEAIKSPERICAVLAPVSL